jgi:DNA-binding NarL/FixJ family response regulator
MPKSILIVDDSSQIRKLVRNFFACETKFEVCGEAVDGIDAIEKVGELNPDLIILDASMPRMNGLEAARALRSMHRGMPIILFTMHADAISNIDASAAGITSVISKMASLSELSKCVEILLRRGANGRHEFLQAGSQP